MTSVTAPETVKDDKAKLSKGGHNLIILGVAAIFIAFATTFVALKIYHDSGDIYLDRSRPGFLPEKEEAEAEKDPADFEFKDSGPLTPKFSMNTSTTLNRKSIASTIFQASHITPRLFPTKH